MRTRLRDSADHRQRGRNREPIRATVYAAHPVLDDNESLSIRERHPVRALCPGAPIVWMLRISG